MYTCQFVVFVLGPTCEPPSPTTGGTFTCDGMLTNFGDKCTLVCDSSNGYGGDGEITCNEDNEDGTVGWNLTPTCICKHKLIRLTIMNMKLLWAV